MSNNLRVPPCIAVGSPMNSCARTLYQKVVEGTGELFGEWRGWRVSGNTLIAPDRSRITLQRLEVLMLLDSNAQRGQRLQLAANSMEGPSS